jgi:hypothetical protein
MWGGSRFYTNRAIEFIDSIRSPNPAINSRKRFATFGNPGSDLHVSQIRADAVDFNLVEDHDAATKLARHFGWRGSGTFPDYGTFTTQRKVWPLGRVHTFRHQIIAGTHGTGPHLHHGVERWT